MQRTVVSKLYLYVANVYVEDQLAALRLHWAIDMAELQITADYGERFEGPPVREGHLSWRMLFWRSNWFPHLTRKMKIDKIVLNQLRSHSAPSDPKSTPIFCCLHNINTHTHTNTQNIRENYRSFPSVLQETALFTLYWLYQLQTAHILYTFHPDAMNTFYLKLRIKCMIYFEFVVYHKFNTQYILFSVSNIVYWMPEYRQNCRNM